MTDDALKHRADLQHRAVAAEFRAEALCAALERIIKRATGCTPLVATDVLQIAEAALAECCKAVAEKEMGAKEAPESLRNIPRRG